MHAHAYIFTQHRQIFPQVELIAQFIHRRMPLADLFHRLTEKAATAPACLLPCACAQSTEAETSCPCRTGRDRRRTRDADRRSARRFHRTRPSDPRCEPALFIKCDGALGQFASPQNSRVIRRDPHESRHRRNQPPGRESMRPERSPGQEHREDSQKKPHIPQAKMNFLVVRQRAIARAFRRRTYSSEGTTTQNVAGTPSARKGRDHL